MDTERSYGQVSTSNLPGCCFNMEQTSSSPTWLYVQRQRIWFDSISLDRTKQSSRKRM